MEPELSSQPSKKNCSTEVRRQKSFPYWVVEKTLGRQSSGAHQRDERDAFTGSQLSLVRGPPEVPRIRGTQGTALKSTVCHYNSTVERFIWTARRLMAGCLKDAQSADKEFLQGCGARYFVHVRVRSSASAPALETISIVEKGQ